MQVVKEVMLEHLCPSGVESVALTPAISGSGLHVAIACIRRIESSSSVTVGLVRANPEAACDACDARRGLVFPTPRCVPRRREPFSTQMDCASNYHLTWNRSLPAVCALESRLALAATHCSRMLQLTWDAPRKAPPGSEGPGTALEAPRPTAVVIGKGTQGLMRLPQGRGRFALSATGCLAAEATCHRGAVSVRVWSTLPAVFTVLDGEQSGDVDLGAVDEAMWKGSRKMAHYELAIAAMWSLVHRWSVSDAVVQMRAMLRIYPLLPHWNSFMMYVLRTGQMLDGMMKALDMVGAQQVRRVAPLVAAVSEQALQLADALWRGMNP